MAAYSTRTRPDFTSGRVDTPDVANVLLDFADRQAKQEALGMDRVMQQAKLEEDRKRYETELGFKQRAEDRLLKEQAASDQYYKSLLNGPQSVGGALNTQSFMNEATKYDMTPEEIAFSNTNKITTADQARKFGNENLAKKIEGQMGLSNLADRLYSDGTLQESRVQMLEVALRDVVNQGLPVPKELAAQIDQARLAEQTAQEAKLKANSEELASLEKDRVANLKYMISNMGSGSGTATVLDESGNPVTVSTGKTLQKEIAAQNKGTISGVDKLQSTINKMELTPKQKEMAIAISDEAVTALVNKNVPTEAAYDIVAKELSLKENNPILSKIWISDKNPSIDKNSVSSFADMILDKNIKLGGVPVVNSEALADNAKFNAARELVASTGAATDSRIAKLNAERKALLMSPEDRMKSRIDAAVAGLNPSATTVPSSIDMSKFNEGDFDMNRYLKKTTNVESSGNIKAQSPGGGSYYGLGQLNRKSVEDMGYDWGTYLNDRNTQVNALQKFTMNNIDQMKKSNIPVNDFTVYLAHNQGIEGAKQILSGKTPSKEILVNMLNQGIANDLPKIPKGRAGEGQIDKAQVMKDSTITAESLVKEYNPVDNYLRKFSKKFNVDITKQNGNVSINPTKDETEGNMKVEPSPLEKNRLYAKAQLMMTPDQKLQLNKLFEAGDKTGIDELVSTVVKDSDINLNKSKATKELFDKSGTNSGSDTTESKKTDLEKVESTLNTLNKGRTEPLKGSNAVDALVSNGVDRKDAESVVFKNARIYSTSPESRQVEIKRNYLIAKREGKPYNGATADEWYDMMNAKQKIGAQGWVFPLIAAAPVATVGGASILGGGAAGATESTIAGSVGRQTAIESVLPKVTRQVNALEKEIPQLTKQYEKMRKVIAGKKYHDKESSELADRVLNEIKSRQEMLRNLTKDKEVLDKLSGKSNSGDSKILEELIKKY